MSYYIKINEDDFKDTRDNLSRYLTAVGTCLSNAKRMLNNQSDLVGKVTRDDETGEIIEDTRPIARMHNGALHDMQDTISGAPSIVDQSKKTPTAMTEVLKAVAEYNGIDPSIYDEVNIEEGELPEGPTGVIYNLSNSGDPSFSGPGQGTETDFNIDPPTMTFTPDPTEPTNPSHPTPTNPTDPTTPSYPTPTNPTDPTHPTYPPGPTDTPTPTDDDPGDDPDPFIPTGVVPITPGNTDPSGPGGIIDGTVSIVGGLVDPDNDTGADMADVAVYGAAGAGALMLGLTTPGGDANFLSNLASGSDDRPLDGVGLDVFDHPDYTSGDGKGNAGYMSSNGAGGAGSDSELGDPNSLSSQFDIKSAGELDGDSSSGGKGGNGLGKGVATLAGAAAVGGAAAGIAVGIDAEQGKGGRFGEGSDYIGSSKKSLNAMFFGELEDEDAAKKNQQETLERVSLILMGASSASSFGTFILANMSVINPLWFLIAALFFGGSYVYTDIVKDRKYKRKQELEKEGKLVKATKPYFGISKDKKLVKTSAKADDAIKEPDWILLGMVLLSSSAFILKSFDVISWLIFLLLLILFILIIVVYIILKKKLGEEK